VPLIGVLTGSFKESVLRYQVVLPHD